MRVNTHALRRIVLMLILVMSLSALMPLAGGAQPADNGGPGNSGAAKLCQKGNWANLARATDSVTPFTNQDECVSYGAEGGTIVDLVVGNLYFANGVWDFSHCDVDVYISDFPATSVVVVTYWDGTSATTTTLSGPSDTYWEVFIPAGTTVTATGTFTNPTTGVEQTVNSSNSYTCTAP